MVVWSLNMYFEAGGQQQEGEQCGDWQSCQEPRLAMVAAAHAIMVDEEEDDAKRLGATDGARRARASVTL